MSLADQLKAQIAAGGPLTVADYMTACLHDPQDGYYATRAVLGEYGDFITAPLVSQIFGELIGLWAVATWQAMGSPHSFVFAEAGPGDGTLMADMLRAARLEPAFLAAASLWLVEASPAFAAQQAQRLAQAPIIPHWTGTLCGLPEGPLILVSNELLDCLPPRQFVRTASGWAERRVGLGSDGQLAFGLAPAQADLPDAPEGSLYEDCAAQVGFANELAQRIFRHSGAALLIDYGRDEPGFGDTLQALSRHQMVDPLICPGEADITVHADFPAVLAAARAAGANAGLMTQGQLLLRLGLLERAEALAAATDEAGMAVIERQVERLVAPDQMGELFKAAWIYSEGIDPPLL